MKITEVRAYPMFCKIDPPSWTAHEISDSDSLILI